MVPCGTLQLGEPALGTLEETCINTCCAYIIPVLFTFLFYYDEQRWIRPGIFITVLIINCVFGSRGNHMHSQQNLSLLISQKKGCIYCSVVVFVK